MFVPVLAGAELICLFSEYAARSCVGFALEAGVCCGRAALAPLAACRGRCERGPEGEAGVREGAKPAPRHPKYSGNKVLPRRENTGKL